MKQYFRITMLWLAVAMIAPMMTSCDEFFGLIDNPVTPALRVYTETLVVGEGHSLKINATTQDHVMLTYASSDPSVAIVDAEGKVIGVSEGKATITVTAQGDDDYYRNQIFGTNTHTVDVAVVKYDPTAIKLLADAQKEGALVSITFNLDGTDYIAYFRLINGEYVLQNGPAAARGVTRTFVEEADNNKIIFNGNNNTHMTLTGHASINGISISGSGGSANPVTTQNKVLIATWTVNSPGATNDGDAFAQVQIDCETGEMNTIRIDVDEAGATAGSAQHDVEVGGLKVNDQTVYDQGTQDEADKAKDKDAGKDAGKDKDKGKDKDTDKDTSKDKTDKDKDKTGGGTTTGGSGGGSDGGGSSTGRIAATDYKFTETDVYMLVGDTKYLQYTCFPKNAYVRFSSSHEDVIEVNETTGLVKAKGAGTAMVTISNSGLEQINADAGRICKITVIDPAKIDDLFNNAKFFQKITSEMIKENKINFLVGDIASTTEQTSLRVAPFLAEKICKMNVLNKVVLFLGGDEEVGYYFYLIDGSTKEFYTFNSDDAIPSKWENIKLYYVQKLVTSITLSSSTLTLVVGEADVTLTATVKPDDAADKTVTWSSNNKAAATVVDGTVHAVAAGNATITAKAGDKTATCAITVLAESLTPQNARKMAR